MTGIHVLTHDQLSASVADRERWAVGSAMALERLRSAAALPGVREAMAISTCNRVEWVLCGDHTREWAPALFPGGAPREYHGPEAVERLCRVACGLESVAVGEPQILGQMRAAWGQSERAGTAGPELAFVLPRVIGLAKRVRRKSGLGKGATSAAHLAADLALAATGGDGLRVLIIGAGKMASLLAHGLRSRGVTALHVANRTFEHAVEFGQATGACPVDVTEIRSVMRSVDIVFAACSAPHPLLRAADVADAGPLLLVDLAVPRNIDPAVRAVPGVRLIDMDDIQAAAGIGQEARREAAAKAEPMLRAELAALLRRLELRPLHASLRSMQSAWDAIRLAELDRVRRKLGGVGERDWRLVETLAWRLTRKLTHEPLLAAKRI